MWSIGMNCMLFITLLVKESETKIFDWLINNGYQVRLESGNNLNSADRSSHLLVLKIATNQDLDTSKFLASFVEICHKQRIYYHSLIAHDVYHYVWYGSNIQMKSSKPKPKKDVPYLKIVKPDN